MEHTKSSPIGPAEHEEGGSLQDNSQYSGSSSKKQLVIASGEWGVEMKRSSDRGKTHRPRSVSSLLILLRAMLGYKVSGTRICDAREDVVEETQSVYCRTDEISLIFER